jgi:glycosyltransferase involved in cell wall biosynthesis
MADLKPLVSIGLPVYNGERYLGKALDCLLSQTFTDFDIIVCDNASIDATASIARAYAERNARVKYHRNPSNIGAIRNFNRAFELATGKYFKWHACDDLCAPTYLEKCVAVLEEDSSAALCHSRTILIDDAGEALTFDPELQLFTDRKRTFAYHAPDQHFADSDDPVIRFREALLRTTMCQYVMALMRADVARKSGLLAMYYYADRAFLIEMALRGRFREVPEALFFNRLHEHSSRMIASARERAAWGGAPAWISPFDLLNGYLNITLGVLRADVSLGAKMRCLGFAVSKAAAAQIGRRKGAHGPRQQKRISSPVERFLNRTIESAELGDRTAGDRL